MNGHESMTSTKNQNDQSVASDQVLLSLVAKIHVFFMYHISQCIEIKVFHKI